MKRFLEILRRFYQGLKKEYSTNQNSTKDTRPDSDLKGIIKVTPMDIAESELGVNERDNPEMIRAFHKTVGIVGGAEVPWCSSFMSYCFEHAGYGGPRTAWARDWLAFGYETNEPKKGDVCIFSRNITQGHVGFFIKEDKDYIWILSGNCDNKVKIKPYPRSNLLGIRTY